MYLELPSLKQVLRQAWVTQFSLTWNGENVPDCPRICSSIIWYRHFLFQGKISFLPHKKAFPLKKGGAFYGKVEPPFFTNANQICPWESYRI